MKVLLIDGFNLIRRIYEASSGAAIDEVSESIARSAKRALLTHQPSHVVLVTEQHDRTWRHLLYPEYKAGRKPTPQALTSALPQIEKRLLALSVKSVSLPNYEADDIIATLAAGIAATGGQVVILSTDKSYLQLLNDQVHVFDHFKHIEITATDVVKKYGIPVSKLIDFWALAGDAGNHIKGVEKIGKKTAAALLQQYGSLQAILDSSDDSVQVARVQQSAALAQRCKMLVTLKLDVQLGINMRDYRIPSQP